MDTIQFLRHILPTQGVYVASIQSKRTGRFFNKSYDNIEDLASVILAEDKKGNTVYHACASFAEHRDKRMRTAENAAWVRSQWIDIDVGPEKDYASRKEALQALAAFCKQHAVPKPTIVSSGRGFHCYWTFTTDYPVSDFTASSEGLLFYAKKAGFRHDTSRTTDPASVLRPVGSTHRKADPVLVKVVHEGTPLDAADFYDCFDALGAPPKYFASKHMQSEGWESSTSQFPPSSAKLIAKECGAFRDFGRHKSTDAPMHEGLWRGMLGLVKHTTEGEKLAHRWSKQSDARYSEAETQEKLDNWLKGPTTCTNISQFSERCAGCTHFGKITSPISLGYAEDKPPPQVAMDDAKAKKLVTRSTLQYAEKIPGTDKLPFFPSKYAWDGKVLSVFEKNAKGVGEWKAFSTTLYYPYIRYETADNTRAMMVCALIDPKRSIWRIFELETSKVADPRQLAMALGAQEIVYMSNSKERHQKYVQDILAGLRHHGLETTTYSSFGWHGDGFVMGDKMVTRKGSVPVYLSNKVPSDLQGSLGCAGTASGWVDAVDKVYNRLGAEPYQFTILSCFAAPLVYLCDSDLWHGIPQALTGESGKGKSTAGLVGCSIYGNPKKLMIQANEEGTTINALLQRVGVFRHMPMLLDEITGRETQELQALLFALSNGEPKRRLRPDGTEVNTNLGWDTLSIVTGNLSMTRTLADSDRTRADATQVRCFEIPLDDVHSASVFKDVNGKELIERDILASNYGVVGEEFLRYVIRNRAKVEGILQRERGKMANTVTGTDPRERFYYDLIATTLVAGALAKSLGFINFDLKRLRAWALNHVNRLRTIRSSTLSTAEDYLQALLSELHQHTVTTKFYRDGRQKPPEKEMEVLPLRDPLARHATNDKRFIITRNAFNNWCGRHKVAPDWLKTHLEKEGFLLNEPVGGVRQRLFKGTSVAGSAAHCMEFNYDQIDSTRIHLPDYMTVVGEGEEKSPAV